MWTRLRAWCAAANTLSLKPAVSEPWRKSTVIGASFVSVLYVMSRVVWYVRDGALGFGYDTGIYRHIITGYWDKRGQGLPAFGFTHLTNALHSVGFSTDLILIGGYVASSLLLAGALYAFLKNTVNRRAALVGVFILTVSLTQIELYHWFYYRNLLAAALVLLAFAYRSRIVVGGICLGLVGIIHPLSLVPAGLALVASTSWDKKSVWQTAKVVFLTALISLGFNWAEWFRYLEPLWQYRGLATAAAASAPEFSGQFITVHQWLVWSWPYLIFAIPGIWLTRRSAASVWCLALFSAVGIVFQVLFYRRLIVWLDLAAIGGAAITIEHWWQQWRAARYVVSAAAVVSLVWAGQFTWRYQPAMTDIDWLALQQLNTLPPQSLIMTITSQYAPWLYGYTNQRIIAPGMLDENIWNQTQWEVFWTTRDSGERSRLLSHYPASPIYIFLTQDQQTFSLLFSNNSHFAPLTAQIWQFNNPNYPQEKNANQ